MNWYHITCITLVYNCQRKTSIREFMCTKGNGLNMEFLEKHDMKVGL
jgi:hypothetical protein